MAQKYIKTTYPDGSTVISNLRRKKGIPVLSPNGTYTATRVTTWWDGSAMNAAKADGLIYLQEKTTGDYYKVDLPNRGQSFLEKDTMAQMRALTPVEILLLQDGYYKGVKLNGYYVKNDTPAPIQYLLSTTSATDDGGSVIEVGGVKLEHNFGGHVDVGYFGLVGDGSTVNNPQLVNNIFINNKDCEVIFPKGYTFIMKTGTWWANDTITPTSNCKITIDGIVKNEPSRSMNSSLIFISRVDNVVVQGSGELVGYKHNRYPIGVNDKFYKTFKQGITFNIGDYVYIESYGYLVKSGGVGNSVPTVDITTPLGTEFTLSGGLVLSLFEKGLGEWNYGILIHSSTNVTVNNVKLSAFWGDGMEIMGDEASEVMLKPSKNIIINNIECIDNRRQGLSIVNAENVEVNFSKFSDTYGTLPTAGVDLEPNPDAFGYVRNVRFNNCLFNGNSAGVLLYNPYQDPSRIDDVVFDTCYFNSNRLSNVSANKAGNLTLRNCKINGTTVGNYSGELDISCRRLIIESCELNINLSESNLNSLLLNIKNAFSTDVSEEVTINNTIIKNTGKRLAIIDFISSNSKLKFTLSNSEVRGNVLYLTASNVGSMQIADEINILNNPMIECGQSYLDDPFNKVVNKYKISGNIFKVKESIYDKSLFYSFNSKDFIFDRNILEQIGTNTNNFKIADIVSNGGRFVLKSNIFKNFTRTSGELFSFIGSNTSNSTLSFDSNTLTSCELYNLIKVDRSTFSIIYVNSNVQSVSGCSNKVLDIIGDNFASSFRLNVNMNSFLAPMIFDESLLFGGFINVESNILDNKFRIKNNTKLSQAPYVSDEATLTELIQTLRETGLIVQLP